jgi:hypothetical protein
MKILMALVLLAVSAWAESVNVNGKWRAVMDAGRGRKVEAIFYFKANGAKVTGFVKGPQGEHKIFDGALDDNILRFTVMADEVKVLHKAVVSGDRLFIEVESGKQHWQMGAERIKE